MLTIHFPSGETLEVQPAQGSRAVEQLLQPAFVEAQFALARWVEVPVGAWVELEGRRYTLYAPAAATRDGATLYDYRARFESEARGLEAIVTLNPVDGRAAFPLTASPAEHAGLVVQNMNARGGGGWRLGGCVEGAPKEISYDGTPCLAALGRIAEAFGTEWNCDGKVITIGRVGHGAEDPVPLRYGEGLKPGLQRTVHSEDGNPVGRLFVQGGERNVSFSDYGKKRLHLPKAKTISFDGLHFEGEAEFAAARAVRYTTDAEGTSVARADALPGVTYREATLALEECYPRREGTVTGVSADGLDFMDSTIPNDLNYRDARIGGEKATIIFQSGMLAGREFDIVQTETDLTGYDHGARRFQLVPQDEDGVSMPGGVFVPRVGDRYAVFHINMPPRYVRDAEEEMLRGAVRYLHPRAGHRFTVRAELDAAWARARWNNLGGRLGLGGYVAIEDRELFGASGAGRAVLRVVEVSRPLGDPHAPTLTLSNEPAAGGIFTQLARARAQEQVVATRHAEAVRYTRRTFRQAREGLKQLEEVAKRVDDFKESIKPATVTTMGALVGSEATNFTFVNRVEFTWEGAGKRLRARAVDGGAMVLEHATLGGDPRERGTIGTTGAAARRWNLYAFVSGALTAAGKPYFLYAECPNGEGKTDGHFAISMEARPLREGDRYNLLCALVSSEDGLGHRGVQPVFGVTEVTPGMVRTSRIVSRGGETYFDLEHGEIGGNIRFTIPEANEPAAGKKRGQGFTLVEGGRLRTFGLELMKGRGAAACTTAGLWGGGDTGDYNENTPAFWAGGTFTAAMQGEAKTILRHNGSAKIGRMLVAKEGDMAWTDNDGMFEINPTKAMPTLDTLKNNVGLNETGGSEAKLARNISASSLSRYTTGAPKTDNNSDSSRDPTNLLGFLIKKIIWNETVEVVVTVTLRADLSAQQLYSDGIGIAEANAQFKGELVAGGERQEVSLYLQANNDSSSQGAQDSTQTYTLRSSGGCNCTLQGTLSSSVQTQTRDKWVKGKETPKGFSSWCTASAANVKVEVSYTVYYEAVKGQQAFIIARDGFCVFHNANRYIYCNAHNGEFKVMGLTDFSRV